MPTRLVKGNTAVVVGALYAGCAHFFGYPITPANEIVEDAAEYFPRLGRGFLQAESETAAISMIYGAAAAGQRAMTASSGPGISLMVEGLSYLAGAQLPCVLVDIMRAGPGLGNIGPEQSDYNQVVKGGGHGAYRNIVLAPESVQEMCDFTVKAFELADKYRMPAIVLADGVLGQMAEPLTFPAHVAKPAPDPAWAVAGTADTRENVITSIHLDFDVLEQLTMGLQERYAALEAEEPDAAVHSVTDADVILVAYGISSRIARSAVERARLAGYKVGLLRPKSLFPFPRAVLRELAESGDRRFLTVEMSPGQLADDVRLAIDCSCPVDVVYRLGGNLPTVEQVMDSITQILG